MNSLTKNINDRKSGNPGNPVCYFTFNPIFRPDHFIHSAPISILHPPSSSLQPPAPPPSPSPPPASAPASAPYGNVAVIIRCLIDPRSALIIIESKWITADKRPLSSVHIPANPMRPGIQSGIQSGGIRCCDVAIRSNELTKTPMKQPK